MLLRFVNISLLALLVIQGTTGIYMLYGTWQPWLFDLHRISGFALVAILPWKLKIMWDSLKRGVSSRFDRSVVIGLSVLQTLVIFTVIALALMWLWRIGPYRTVAYQTVIAWHWMLGLATIPFVAFHVWRRWPGLRREDFLSRRGALRTLGLASAGVLGWLLGAEVAEAQASEERPRREVTGSRGFGVYTGNDFPITGERTVELAADQWQLTVSGGAVPESRTFSYQHVLDLRRREAEHTLDCTSGWYTIQNWQGTPLLNVLAEARADLSRLAGVRLASVTGYNHTYPLQEARNILLATHVGGEVLAPRHGYPLRAVVPDRRGWFWVKWLVRVEALDDPLDVIAGTLWSPRQVLRQF